MKKYFLRAGSVFVRFGSLLPQVKQIRHNRITAILEHEQTECD